MAVFCDNPRPAGPQLIGRGVGEGRADPGQGLIGDRGDGHQRLVVVVGPVKDHPVDGFHVVGPPPGVRDGQVREVVAGGPAEDQDGEVSAIVVDLAAGQVEGSVHPLSVFDHRDGVAIGMAVDESVARAGQGHRIGISRLNGLSGRLRFQCQGLGPLDVVLRGIGFGFGPGLGGGLSSPVGRGGELRRGIEVEVEAQSRALEGPLGRDDRVVRQGDRVDGWGDVDPLAVVDQIVAGQRRPGHRQNQPPVRSVDQGVGDGDVFPRRPDAVTGTVPDDDVGDPGRCRRYDHGGVLLIPGIFDDAVLENRSGFRRRVPVGAGPVENDPPPRGPVVFGRKQDRRVGRAGGPERSVHPDEVAGGAHRHRTKKDGDAGLDLQDHPRNHPDIPVNDNGTVGGRPDRVHIDNAAHRATGTGRSQQDNEGDGYHRQDPRIETRIRDNHGFSGDYAQQFSRIAHSSLSPPGLRPGLVCFAPSGLGHEGFPALAPDGF